MRAVICHAWGEVDSLRVEEIAPPAPAADEVLIDVRATAVNYADSIMVAGRYQTRPPFPFSPGIETAGIVARCGPDVTRFRPGDRVMATLAYGGLAEQAVAKEAETFAVPEGMPFEEAGAFPISYISSHVALRWQGRLEPGETLLVLGSAGGVGLTAVEIGKAMGRTSSRAPAYGGGKDHGVVRRGGRCLSGVWALCHLRSVHREQSAEPARSSLASPSTSGSASIWGRCEWSDINGHSNVIGDGINVAQRVMSFSRPGQLLVSRSFYEVVSCLSRDYANLFRHEGSRTDKHVREHEVYSAARVGDPPNGEPEATAAAATVGARRASSPRCSRLAAVLAREIARWRARDRAGSRPGDRQSARCSPTT
jgi:hypothetical protein